MRTTDGGATWMAQTAPSGIDGLGSIACASPTVCEAGGWTDGNVILSDSPLMIGTTDGGSTWTTQTLPSGIGNQLAEIVCPSTTVCEEVAFDDDGIYFGFPLAGEIVGTTDGGSTWTAQTLPSGDFAVVTNIACPSPTVCEIVGQSSSDTAVILGTNDSGSTWTTQTTLNGSTEGFAGGIACASTAVCEAAGGGADGETVVGTTDGGSTWTTQTLPSTTDELYDIICPSTTACEATGVDTLSGYFLIRTTDGGSTWNTQTLPAGITLVPYEPIVCPSTSVCLAVGENNSYETVLLGTTDGGSTWTVEALPSGITGVNPNENAVAILVCATPTTCEVSGEDSAGNPVMLGTTDSGSTWTTQTLPSGIESLSDIVCPSTTVCEAAGTNSSDEGVLFGTTDGGSTWTAQALPSGIESLLDLVCPSTTVCEAVGTNSSDEAVPLGTTDGGSTWTAQTLPSAASYVYNIVCPSTTVCEAVGSNGSNGVAFGTTDGGSTWTTQALPSGVSLSDIVCPSTTVCEAGGANNSATAVVVGTTNGGSTWSAQTLPSELADASGLGIVCPSTTVCEATGDDFPINAPQTAVAAGTTNGGTTWSQQTLPSGVDYVGNPVCSSTTMCELTADNGSGPAVLGTTDGGSTWTTQTLPSGVFVNDIICPSTTMCEATAEGEGSYASVIVGTTDGGSTWTTQTLPSGETSIADVACPSTTACLATGTSAWPDGVTIFSLSSPPTSPAAPMGLTASLGVGQATLSWTAPDDGGSPITSYTVNGTDTTTSTPITPVTVTGSPPATSTPVTGLTPGDSYSLTVTATNTIGTSPASSPLNELMPAPYFPVSPARICDTRSNGNSTQCVGKTLHAGSSLNVQVTGNGGVPAGATAVVANVTATEATAASFLTTYPAGSARPNASNLNFTAGETVPNLVTVPLSSSGAITLYNASGSVNVLVDVDGYYGPGSGQGFTSLTPSRICDTRSNGNSTPCVGKTLSAGGNLKVQVTGSGGVPSGATAVVANVTVTGATASSFLTAYADGTVRPLASNLNFTAGESVPNRVIIPLSSSGELDLYNASGSVNAIIDVDGYFNSSVSGYFEPVAPARICDSRNNGNGTQCQHKTLSPGGVLNVQVTGNGGVPSGAAAVVANVTATGASAQSFLTVYPEGATRPTASDLNFTAGQTVPNLCVAKLSATGGLAIYNALGSVNALVDVAGWFTS